MKNAMEPEIFITVDALWSVTLHDGTTKMRAGTPPNPYVINAARLLKMKKNEDGSFMVYIQKNSPGADKESNWLPTLDDNIQLAMRLSWPESETPQPSLPTGL